MLVRELEEALAEIPALDVHTHLSGGNLGATGLHDILLYHMVISDLYSAGCPNGARLTEFPGAPDDDEAHDRIQEALPFLPAIQNTSCMWGVRLILNDLHGWREPVTPENWRKLDALIRERADDKAWHRSILDRANIKRSCAEYARKGPGDERLQYSLEWGMFTRTQWGEYDTALYDLERTWGRKPESPAPVGGKRPPSDRTIRSLDDVHAAIRHYVAAIPYADVLSTATGISTDIDYAVPTDDEMAQAIDRRSTAGPRERDVYAAYICAAFLTELEKHGDEIVFQFSIGAEPLPFETGSRLSQRTIAQLAEMVGRHPRLRFQAFLACKHANQAFCTLARELPNFSLAGYWWHNFFPQSIRQIMSERLDMVSVNKQMGFFSDAYVVEWAYAKGVIVRKQMAQVFAEKIDQGQYTLDDALSVARSILFESPQALLGMRPIDAG
jgi:glucuronate isomerase